MGNREQLNDNETCSMSLPPKQALFANFSFLTSDSTTYEGKGQSNHLFPYLSFIQLIRDSNSFFTKKRNKILTTCLLVPTSLLCQYGQGLFCVLHTTHTMRSTLLSTTQILYCICLQNYTGYLQ